MHCNMYIMFVLVKHRFLLKKPDCAISWSTPTIAL
jgi:hypothetical protein